MSRNDGTTKVLFRYRPDGLRHSKRVEAGGTVTITTHYWDGSDIIAETTSNGTLKACYLRGNGELIAQQIGTGLSYYLHNAHGDVTERVDSSGNILKAYQYDSFGNILNPATVGNPVIYVDQSPFGYCGEYLDKETGETYLRARYYDATAGRFTCEDPQRDGNQYTYCGNEPVNHEDPSGLRHVIIDDAGDYVKPVVRVVPRPSAPPPSLAPALPSRPRPSAPAPSLMPMPSAAGNVGIEYLGSWVPWKTENSTSRVNYEHKISNPPVHYSMSSSIATVSEETGNRYSPYVLFSNMDYNPLDSTAGIRFDNGVYTSAYTLGLTDTSVSVGVNAPGDIYAGLRVGVNAQNLTAFVAFDYTAAPVNGVSTTTTYMVEIDLWIILAVVGAYLLIPYAAPVILSFAAIFGI